MKVTRMGFDADDVLFNIDEVAKVCFKEEFGIDYVPNARTEFKIRIPEVDDLTIYNTINKWLETECSLVVPADGAVEAVAEHFEFFGRPFVVITARPESHNGMLRDMMRYHFGIGMSDLILFCTPKKKEYAKSLGLASFVDDRASNAASVAESVERSYLVDRSWNSGRELPGNVIRVGNAFEAVRSEISLYRKTQPAG